MMLLACHCLNVKIHTKQKDSIVFNFKEDFPADQFFQQKLAEIEVTDPGIQQEHSYLVHKRHVGNWVLHKCLSCGIDAYATQLQTRTSKILVNEKIQSEPALIERLKQSSQYSDVFNIVLPSQNLDFSGAIMPDVSSRNYESLQYELSEIQEQLNNFILSQETAMEERIRLYEEQQRAEFQQLQAKVRKEKKGIISLLLNAAETKSVQNQSANDRNSNGSDNTSWLKDFRKESKPHRTPVQKTPVSRSKSSPVKAPPPPDHSLDSEGFFMLDELGQENEEPFYSSSEEEQDSQTDDLTPAPNTVKKKALMYSTSVPISVPTWKMETPNRVEESTDEEGSFNDPVQIAASMQALAQSIKNDDRCIFGDRPRPRLNTGDFQWK